MMRAALLTIAIMPVFASALAADPKLPAAQAINAMPLGDVAGAQPMPAAAGTANPVGDDSAAIELGGRLFVAMNCAGCHGYDAKGAMGPDLTDSYWRYGGTPAAIYNSIGKGRPQGMPAWERALPPIEIWRLTAYIQSLGGSFAAQHYQQAVEGDLAKGTTSATTLPEAAHKGRR
jgi:cytochrome c oxidase cbb3-type subunit 3